MPIGVAAGRFYLVRVMFERATDYNFRRFSARKFIGKGPGIVHVNIGCDMLLAIC